MLNTSRRPAGSGSFNFSDIPGWESWDNQKRAEILVADWIQFYEGDDAGPLSRKPAAEWAREFIRVGYFDADYESGTVALGRTVPPLPDLFRGSVPGNACRFSWFEGAGMAVALLLELHRVPAQLRVWYCREPLYVFGKITYADGAAEWIVAPGEVHEVRLVERGRTEHLLSGDARRLIELVER